MDESLLFIGAGAGAGEKNVRSRPRMDRLHNTGSKPLNDPSFFLQSIVKSLELMV